MVYSQETATVILTLIDFNNDMSTIIKPISINITAPILGFDIVTQVFCKLHPLTQLGLAIYVSIFIVFLSPFLCFNYYIIHASQSYSRHLMF